MSTAKPEAVHDLNSFADFLQGLQEGGFEFVVIGGAAISAYARQLQVRIATVDLDLYLSPASLDEILRWAPRHGVKVLKRPRPRNIQVAFLEADGREINLLTASYGMPAPEFVIRHARAVELPAAHLEVLIADPFDLLRNKLAIRREKDLPHIEFLNRFIEEEIVAAFESEELPRQRISPAKRYLEIRGLETLPETLAERLLVLAKTPADFRFLASRLPLEGQLDRLLEKAPDVQLKTELEGIRAARKLPTG